MTQHFTSHFGREFTRTDWSPPQTLTSSSVFIRGTALPSVGCFSMPAKADCTHRMAKPCHGVGRKVMIYEEKTELGWQSRPTDGKESHDPALYKPFRQEVTRTDWSPPQTLTSSSVFIRGTALPSVGSFRPGKGRLYPRISKPPRMGRKVMIYEEKTELLRRVQSDGKMAGSPLISAGAVAGRAAVPPLSCCGPRRLGSGRRQPERRP